MEANLEPAVLVSLAPGSRLGDYVIEGLLGTGGMGRVYAARSLEGDRCLAIKHFGCRDPAQLFRFKREFRMLADTQHDNLIALGDLTVLGDGEAYFTMERIVGRTFVDWVRRDVPVEALPNLARLRRAMRQLIAGTEHLHRSGFVHRDLKPSNVLVTEEGRVVILDFGLIREIASAGQTWTRDGQTLGTPNYMAPEQVGDQSIGPAADWYAVGVMLFEGLTGRRPFLGTPMQVLLAKLDDRTPHPAESMVGVPEPFVELCRRLLSSDPDERPQGEELLQWFGDPSVPKPADGKRARGLIGRLAELERLQHALVRSRTGQTVCVLVKAPDGFGKSTLVEHFVDRLGPDAVLLRGRCHLRESLPFKGIDSLVDALALRLRHLPELEAAALQPRHLGPLTRLFPVLGDVWKPTRRSLEGEPRELRRLGTSALREVLTRLGDRYSLVLWIDDFHWADIDSVRMLEQLLRPPESPALLIILCSSHDTELAELLLANQIQAAQPTEIIELSALSTDDAEQLTAALLPEAALEHRARLIHQARGSPFALVQLALAGASPSSSSGELADVGIARRFLELDREGRRLVAMVAVAGAPLPEAMLRELFPADAIERLERLGLVVSLDACVTLEHERIREIVRAELAVAEIRELHGELGQRLLAHGAAIEPLVDHFEQAGALERAHELAIAAAQQAADVLAFDRAAAGFRRAIRLAKDQPHERLDPIRERLVEQLVQLGQTLEAAEILLDVATRAPATVARAHRARAARFLVFSRRVERALPLLAEQLAAVDERLPTHNIVLLGSLIWHRLRLAIRGYGFTVRPEHEIDPDQLARIETLYTVTIALASGGHLPKTALLLFALRSRALLLALEAGEARRLTSVLAIEAVLRAATGKSLRAQWLLSQCRELLKTNPLPELECEVDYCAAAIEWLESRWINAAESFAALHQRVEDTAGGGAWLRAQVIRWTMYTRLLRGDIAEVRRRMAGDCATLRELGNREELLEYGLKSAMVHLYDGNHGVAKQTYDQYISLQEAGHYTFQHASQAMFEVEFALFGGEFERACALIEQTIVEARRHDFYRTRNMRLRLEDLRARSLVLALIATPNAWRLRRRVRRSLRHLRANPEPIFIAQAAGVEAALHDLEGRSAEAGICRARAVEAFARAGMRAHHAAALWRLARHSGEPRLEAEAVGYFEDEGMTGWRGFVAVAAPSPRPVDAG